MASTSRIVLAIGVAGWAAYGGHLITQPGGALTPIHVTVVAVLAGGSIIGTVGVMLEAHTRAVHEHLREQLAAQLRELDSWGDHREQVGQLVASVAGGGSGSPRSGSGRLYSVE